MALRVDPSDAWLILFDIDGTLLHCGSQVREIFRRSLQRVFGTAGRLDEYSFAGRTDLGIVLDLMSGEGLDRAAIEERMESFERDYVEHLGRELDATQMSLLPAVRETLEGLRERDDIVLGLLTGNFERGAQIKLSRLELDGYFSFGAFGDRFAERSALPPLALTEARSHSGSVIGVEQTLIIGDSVLDVRCARDHGIGCVAVTTGYASREELLEEGADWVVDNLVEAARCHPALAL